MGADESENISSWERPNSTDEFAHVFRPATRPGAPVLLLLHGTGGNELDLLPLGSLLDPTAALLGVRGQVLENGMPRFFRRVSTGVFDENDLEVRAGDLAEFIRNAVTRYKFSLAEMVAVGFSNGANIAAATMWLYPGVITSAILFRAMTPFRDAAPKSMAGHIAMISAGDQDSLISTKDVESLASHMRSAGADVSVVWQRAGHNLTQEDITSARDWLAKRRGA